MTKPMRTRSDDGTGAVIETDRSQHIEVDRWAVSPQNLASDFRHSDRRSLCEARTYRERSSPVGNCPVRHTAAQAEHQIIAIADVPLAVSPCTTTL